MKKIKFRAFFKIDEQIYEVASIDFLNKEVTLWDKETAVNFEASFEDIELLQYTGANDKRGVEIYEGDIVKFVSRLDDSKRMGTVRYWAGDAAFLIECEREIFFLFHDALNREVIGNIYENPEILKDIK
nr:MAG TPA: YopX protein [Caudoviricetes sp.]